MKRFTYLVAIMLLLCSICACGEKNNDNFSDNVVIENSGNFSSEMIIEDSSDVTIVEMP